jgi:hypothetical protein
MQSDDEIKDIKPVLLSKSELQWLAGNVKYSKPFQYKMKNSIKRKIQTLTELELPLLVKNNFLVNSDYEIDDDESLGRDLELGPPPPQSLSTNSALVRQRSRVQIPSKAPLFCKKEGEFGPLTLQSVVTALQLAVTELQLGVTSVLKGIKPFSISNGSSKSLKV